MTDENDAAGIVQAGARAEAMGERVLRTAREGGTPAAGIPLLERAYALAMEPRLRARLDDHHPDLLHPGRTALILLLDTAERRPEVLAAAMLSESERPALRVEPERVARSLADVNGDGVAALAREIPTPDAEDLAERLLLADPEVQLVAVAERLDQLRHAHLWNDPERARSAHEVAVRVYAAIAERVHPTLSRRYDWWCRMFERKRLRGGPAGPA